MRSLHINTFYPPHIEGGAEVTLATIVRRLIRQGIDASVVSTHGGQGIVREVVDGVSVIRLPIRNAYWYVGDKKRPAWKRALWHAIDSYNLLMAGALGKAIDEVRPDIISCHNLAGLSCTAWEVASRRGLPVVQVLHDYYAICPKVTMYRNGHCCERQCSSCALYRLPHRRASNAVRAVVGVSKAILDAHLARGLFTNAEVKAVIYNAQELPPAPARSSLSHETVTFGFIGTLSAVKGIELLLRDFAKLASSSARPMRLLVAGSGEQGYVRQLRRHHESAAVTFVGRTTPSDFFPLLDVSVVPSLWQEPLGRVVFESMHYGVPVIGSRRGGIPEMIQHGVNGLLFEPEQPDALLCAMRRLVDSQHELEAMKAAAPGSVATFLDEHRMADEYASLLGGLVRPPGVVPAIS